MNKSIKKSILTFLCLSLITPFAFAAKVKDIPTSKDGLLVLMVDGLKSPGKAQNIIEARALCSQLSEDKSWVLPTREELIGVGIEPDLPNAIQMRAIGESEGRYARLLWIDAVTAKDKEMLYREPQTVVAYQNYPDWGHAEKVNLKEYGKLFKEQMESGRIPEEYRAELQKFFDSFKDGVTVYCVKPKKEKNKAPASDAPQKESHSERVSNVSAR